MRKKGVELSIPLIITAVIALVVLVIVVVIFTNKSGQFSGGISQCETSGGICKEKLSDCVPRGAPIATANSDCQKRNNNKNAVCCKIIMELEKPS